jgi:16S rRNA G966 N2-methylase RsmD
MSIDFPWRQYSNDSILNDYKKLQKKLQDSVVFPVKISHIGYKCTDCFFQKQRLNACTRANVSCIEYWEKQHEKILAYYKSQKVKKDLFGTIVFMKRAPAHFSPYVAGMIYKYFSASSVLDPYAGWGDRCLAAMAMDIEYIGIDSNKGLDTCFANMIRTFPHTSSVVFISGKCEDYIDTIDPNHIDLIFSSPPFWDSTMVEVYPDCETNFHTFMENSLYKIFNKFIHKVPIVLYINEYMYIALSLIYGPSTEILQFGSSTARKKINFIRHSIYCWL